MKYLLLICAFSLPYAASARDAWYTNLHGELFALNDYDFTRVDPTNTSTFQNGKYEFDTGVGVGLSVGREVQQWRGELEVTVRNASLARQVRSNFSAGQFVGQSITPGDEDERLATLNVMGNLYYDIPYEITDGLTPYVGAGLGASRQATGSSETAFAYQGMAGLQYELNERTSFSLGYRYFATTGIHAESYAKSFRAESHILDAGFRIRF